MADVLDLRPEKCTIQSNSYPFLMHLQNRRNPYVQQAVSEKPREAIRCDFPQIKTPPEGVRQHLV